MNVYAPSSFHQAGEYEIMKKRHPPASDMKRPSHCAR
jgi:hypothetical protein